MPTRLYRNGGLNCPKCAALIPWSLVDYRTIFQCNHCRASVWVSRQYLIRSAIAHVILAGVLCFAAGMHGFLLVPSAILLSFPLGFVTSFARRRIAPPPLEIN